MSAMSRRFTAAAMILSLAGLLAGCTTGTTQPPPPSERAGQTRILPDESAQGRIVTVNLPLRYVVMDFELSSPPEIGQRLDVMREGVKIGEIKVSGPIMGSAAAGDIFSGQAAVGDTVITP